MKALRRRYVFAKMLLSGAWHGAFTFRSALAYYRAADFRLPLGESSVGFIAAIDPEVLK